jgi:hypothetical protein
MLRLVRLLLMALALPASWWGTALAADAPEAEPAPVSISRAIPDLHLSVAEMPGETTVRLPLASDSYRLYGLLEPVPVAGLEQFPRRVLELHAAAEPPERPRRG